MDAFPSTLRLPMNAGNTTHDLRPTKAESYIVLPGSCGRLPAFTPPSHTDTTLEYTLHLTLPRPRQEYPGQPLVTERGRKPPTLHRPPSIIHHLVNLSTAEANARLNPVDYMTRAQSAQPRPATMHVHRCLVRVPPPFRFSPSSSPSPYPAPNPPPPSHYPPICCVTHL